MARQLPSLLRGSYRQTRAAFLEPQEYHRPDRPEALLLVPGAFCAAGVLNDLASRLNQTGHSVLVHSPYPHFWGALGHLGPVERAARQLMEEFHEHLEDRRFDAAWLVGHSVGGLIALVALDIAEQEGDEWFSGSVLGVVTMATPFRGAELAPVLRYALPYYRDLVPGAGTLERALRQRRWIRACLQATDDVVVPPADQVLAGVPVVALDGFGHSDVLVGAGHQLRQAAWKIVHALGTAEPRVVRDPRG